MQYGTTLLHPHVVTSTENLAILIDQACSNGYTSLLGTLPCLLQRRLETDIVLRHVDKMCYALCDNPIHFDHI